MYQIQNKVVLVTGSTAGLGKELAFQLCSMGARVVLNGREKERLEQTSVEFRAAGFETVTAQGDVSSPQECQKIIDRCLEAHGRLDVLINNAGLGSGGAFADTTPETFRKVFEVNTLGAIYLTRHALPHIMHSGGSVIFISSLAGLVGLPYSSLYSSSKMALTAIAQALQVELLGSGVHVGIVYIGFLKNGPEKRVLGPSGDLQPTGERGYVSLQPMDNASLAIIRMIRRRSRKTILSSLGKSLQVALRIAPGLVRWFLFRSKKRARRMYEPVNAA